MLEIIQAAEEEGANVVVLSDLLSLTEPPFHSHVIKTLANQGFEMEETLPNLQLAEHLLEVIHQLDGTHHEPAWSSLCTALKAANRAGILVDLRKGSARTRSRMNPDEGTRPGCNRLLHSHKTQLSL